MSNPKGAGRGGKGGLPDEDRKLWELVTQRVEPLRKHKKRVAKTDPAGEAGSPAANASGKPLKGGSAHVQIPQGAKTGVNVPVMRRAEPLTKKHQPSGPSDIDRRRARKLAIGQMQIEARLDLHGMRQVEAHAALRGFLHNAQARGLRNVLVITGKGGGRRDGEHGDGYGIEERGVIRRALPAWLAQGDLRAIVVGFGAASPRHGGDGAYYVHLRKSGR